MRKSEKSGMLTKSTTEILNDLKGNNSLKAMYALRYCALERISDEAIVSAIKDLKASDMVEWNSCKISDCAVAALDLIGIEHYGGTNQQIKDMIKSKFFSDFMQ